MKTRIFRLSVDKVTLIHSSIRSGSVNETMSVIRRPNEPHPHLIHAGRAERAAVIPSSGTAFCEINNNADPSLHDTLNQCWFNVGPAINQHWFNVSYLLGWLYILLCNAILQYLLTCKVNRYCILALHGNTIAWGFVCRSSTRLFHSHANHFPCRTPRFGIWNTKCVLKGLIQEHRLLRRPGASTLIMLRSSIHMLLAWY